MLVTIFQKNNVKTNYQLQAKQRNYSSVIIETEDNSGVQTTAEVK